jgi:nucleotide-binding universal stress UspA family protein
VPRYTAMTWTARFPQLAASRTAGEAPVILVATSGSAASMDATTSAARLANAFEADLIVLRVSPATTLRVGRLAPTIAVAEHHPDPYECPVLLQARRLAWAAGTNARIVLISGDIAPTVLAVTEDVRADLLVVGAQARRAPITLRSSILRQLQRQASCPVLPIWRDHPARMWLPAKRSVATRPDVQGLRKPSCEKSWTAHLDVPRSHRHPPAHRRHPPDHHRGSLDP